MIPFYIMLIHFHFARFVILFDFLMLTFLNPKLCFELPDLLHLILLMIFPWFQEETVQLLNQIY